MPRTESDLEKVTISLRKGDMEWLQRTYPQLGGSRVIREMVRSHREGVEQNMTPIPQAEVDLASIEG